MVQKGINFFGVLFFILAVFYLGRFLINMAWFQNLEIDYKLVPVDAISILVSAALTVWIGWYVTKKLTEQRFEKEFLIKDLNLIESGIADIESLFSSSGNIDVSYVSAKNNEVQLLLDRLNETMKVMEVSNINTADLSRRISDLYLKTTDFDSPTVPIENIDVQTIRAICGNVIIAVRALIMRINKE